MFGHWGRLNEMSIAIWRQNGQHLDVTATRRHLSCEVRPMSVLCMIQSSLTTFDSISMKGDWIVLSEEFLWGEEIAFQRESFAMRRNHTIPVSLENIIGGPACASAKCLVRGYFVLLNKCKTMHIKPASTAMPVVTPSNVGRSEPITDKSRM